MEFSVGNLVKAVDQVGIWSSGTVVSVENGETTVHFTGYASRYDRQIRDPAEIRRPDSQDQEEPGKRKRRSEDDHEVTSFLTEIRSNGQSNSWLLFVETFSLTSLFSQWFV